MEKSPRPLWTTVGKKIVMGATGLLLCLFLVGHLAGNCLLLIGRANEYKAFNAYSNFLNAIPVLLLIELGLAAIFLFHAYDGLVLTLENRKARPVDYEVKVWANKKSDKSRKSVSSSTMMWSGTVILVFVVLHVLHFKYKNALGEAAPHSAVPAKVTVGVASPGLETSGNPAEAAAGAEDLARFVVFEFKKPLVMALYICAMLVLGLHLYHAVASSFQSLGAANPKFEPAIMWFGKAFTIVIAGGFAVLPIWVYCCA